MTVYFIRAGNDGAIKIGFTKGDVSNRLRSLQRDYPDRLTCIRQIPGLRLTEAWLHRRFRKNRIVGEWFTLDQEMMVIVPPNEEDIKSDNLQEEAEAAASLVKARFERQVAKSTTVLRLSRIEAGISQNELSILLGVSSSFLCDCEKGTRNFPKSLVWKLPNDIRRRVADEMVEGMISPSHPAELLRAKELEARNVLTDYLNNLPEGGSTPVVDWDDPADFQTTRPRSILQRLLCGIGRHDWGPVVKCGTSGGFYPIRSCANGCGKRLLRDGTIAS